MQTINFEALITSDLIRRMFEDNIIDTEDKGWVISICGKILTINGKMLFKSRRQAVKAFYNSYHWKVMREMHMTIFPGSDGWGWWDNENRSLYWETFKKVLERDYGLKFIKV